MSGKFRPNCECFINNELFHVDINTFFMLVNKSLKNRNIQH